MIGILFSIVVEPEFSRRACRRALVSVVDVNEFSFFGANYNDRLKQPIPFVVFSTTEKTFFDVETCSETNDQLPSSRYWKVHINPFSRQRPIEIIFTVIFGSYKTSLSTITFTLPSTTAVYGTSPHPFVDKADTSPILTVLPNVFFWSSSKAEESFHICADAPESIRNLSDLSAELTETFATQLIKDFSESHLSVDIFVLSPL